MKSQIFSLGSGGVFNLRFFCFFLLLMSACSPIVFYVGETYSAHPQDYPIEVFFDEKDIKRNFKTIGILKTDPNEMFDVDTPEVSLAQMKKKARKIGGDGILIEKSFERVESSSTSSTAIKQHSDGEKTISSNTQINTVRVLEGKLIKYLD